ncbi:uncharacterized protein PHACADRAFT_92606 [Phanerochaete carnosa HHB-10118-sp]|uniref:Uncharacterized protein n=1 Tax=Phanerochaete carnosa (strain HHB-10118-sp) TaxID=650164 RepID=K5V201_PHACS|nr:uncharacterized protein PHACADRAFT_92606 [Phanerochaete carnosa HHB-10118-sp]EKM56541.1 hypothetical protein PHACADRAFT_92606 [Phanerochaete carnosa HHB-10118-sp]
MSETSATTTPETKKCRIAELVQYSCEREEDASGNSQFHCWPIPRVFRICTGRPAVEITRYVDADVTTGEIKLPPQASQQLPKGKPWRDVQRYPQGDPKDA